MSAAEHEEDAKEESVEEEKEESWRGEEPRYRDHHTHTFLFASFSVHHTPLSRARAMETIHPYGHKKRKKKEKEEVEGGAREASHKGTLHLHLACCFMKGHERLASSNPNEDNERLRAGSPTVLGFQCLGGRAWDLHL